MLQEIASKPTVIDDDQFESKIRAVQEKLDILLEDAKSGSGGGDQTIRERVNSLHDRLENVNVILNKADEQQFDAQSELEQANGNFSTTNRTILEAKRKLTV